MDTYSIWIKNNNKSFIRACFIRIYKNTYFEMNIETDETTQIPAIVKMDLPTRYGSKIVADVQTIRASFYKIDNMNKPLKSM